MSTNPTTPAKPSLRFSLRTFFALLTIACIAGGWYLNRVHRQRAAVLELELRRDIVHYDVCFVPANEIPEPELWYSLTKSGTRSLPEGTLRGRLANILGIDYVATATNVTTDKTVDWRLLRDLPRLEGVEFCGGLDSDGWRQLLTLPYVRTLVVQDLRFKDASPLKDAARIRHLDLKFTEVADLSPLMGMSALTVLDISRTPVTDLSPLHKLPGLRFLLIHDGQFSKEALAVFQSGVSRCEVKISPPLDLVE